MYRWVLCSALAVLASGCQTLRAQPAASELTWHQGQAFAVSEGPRATLTIALASDDPHPLRFDAEVRNTGDSPLVVSGWMFRASGSGLRQCSAAEDPELHLSQLDKEIASLTPPGLVAALDLAVTVGETVTAISGHETPEERQAREARQAEREAQEAERAERLNDLAIEKHQWETQYLRQTTLYPGESVRGLVEFRCRPREGEVFIGLRELVPVVPFRIQKSN